MIETPPSLTGEARYSDQDLEPLRAALLALSKGDFSQQPRTAGEDSSVLGQIWPLVDGVGTELSALNDEVARRAEQVRDIAMVTTAVARGDLTRKVTVDVQGEMLQLKQTVNTMVDQLSAFADEVTRVAREVGTEGRLGGQAHVRDVSGVWEDLTDSVNRMARNLTAQVRNIAQVATAVAQGDLSQKITVDAQGEILELKTTINTMVDQLSAFADEVTRVAREVGTEGRLGGQAEVEGVSGTWKRLTESVNGLASNLTTQVRAIAGVASAVAEGDLTQSITVEASGEVAELKDNINLMVANLRETTRANREQDWLNTNLARLSSLIQGHRDPFEVARLIMSELTPLVSAQYGAFYLAALAGDGGHDEEFERIAAYGFHRSGTTRFILGEGLAGQAALDRVRILVEDAPPGYVTVGSGLGQSAPTHLVVLPILFEDQVLGLLELASLHRFSDLHLTFFDRFMPTIGVTINAIMANSRTEVLLTESQRLATQLQERSDELQRQQGELRRSNAELEEKAALLAKQNRAIEVQNFQIDQARRTLEERAQQLAISSQYKSEFLANMSHELRTPLNSLLVLAKLLSENLDGNLTVKQVEFARTIHEAGADLLQLINDILDLSKVEAGKMEVHPAAIALDTLLDYVDATFRPTAAQKGLTFEIEVNPDVPALIYSDEQRLQQILRNLLSNAVKFTAAGGVTLRVAQADPAIRFAGPLRGEASVLAFAVTDTGIGIAEHKLELIFGAFQQADGTTSRGYGGTGLGLSISRDIARLLGGEIRATSRLGHGSTFTFYLPGRQVAGADSVTALASAGRAASAVAGLDDGSCQEYDPLSGAKILIVDDDVRNVFALTSVFERYGAQIRYAEDGRQGMEILDREDDIALVLMDVMMPELDGYATTAAIRRRPEFADLPIITVTAKAMKGDRAKSIASGASEYVTKPVDISHLIGLMRGWLERRPRQAGLPPTHPRTEGSG
jgi:signal transduction histidine kinase/HAMP domain-containing protein/ActR/RegA family two-component response regulator